MPNGDVNAMLRCQDVVELLADYLDGALEPATARALEAHLSGCRDCAGFMATYRGTVGVVRTLSEHQLPAELRSRLRAFVRRHARS